MSSIDTANAGEAEESRKETSRWSERISHLKQKQNSNSEGLEKEENAEFAVSDDRLFEQLEGLLQNSDFEKRLRTWSLKAEQNQEDVPEDDDSDSSFVLVTKEDAMEGLVDTIASCVMSCPEAQNVNAVELQAAIVKACQELKKSKVKSAWGWCTFIYRTASWTYTAFNVYANPWIVRAIVLAFWSVPRFFGRFLF